MNKIITVVVVVIVACLGLPALLVSAMFADAGGCAPTAATSTPSGGAAGWDSGQVGIARIIMDVGAAKGVPRRGWVIAIATAIQESRLRNLPNLGKNNDHDSVGVFQQRPSQGWGTPTQLADPAYQAAKFYDKLLAVPNWQTMPLTQAAQKVQKSAHPNAYTQWTDEAVSLVNAVGSVDPRADPGNLGQGADNLGPGPAGCLDGETVLARAATWLTAWNSGPVPYLSSSDPTTWYAGYRRDCSGYASMALGLPGPGLNTAALQANSTPLTKQQLIPGDLLINPAPNLEGHVVIFDHWTDTTKKRYVGYEQAGGAGTLHRVITYPYDNGYPMSPFRYRNYRVWLADFRTYAN